MQCRNPKCGQIKILTGGRGNLANHNCKETGAKPPIAPPKSVVREFHRSLVGLSAGRLVPLAIADAPEFSALIQAAINIGAEYGKVEASVIVPSANTLRAVVKDIANKARAYIVNKYRDDIEDGLVSGTIDGWDGGGQRKRKFHTHTLFPITEDFEMQDHILFTTHCKADSVTAPVIREAFDPNMEKLTLPKESKVHLVTDDGTDIVAATANRSRTYCMDHGMNLTVKKSLQPHLTGLDLYGDRGGNVVDSVIRAVNTLKSSRMRKLTALKARFKPTPTDRRKQRVFKPCLPTLKSVRASFSKVSQ